MRPVLTDRELALILSKDICRLSTISANGWPHIVPVSYVYRRGKFYIPTARRAKKVRNLAKNNKATIVVDDGRLEHGVMIECRAKITYSLRGRALLSSMILELHSLITPCSRRPSSTPIVALVYFAPFLTFSPPLVLALSYFLH